MQCSGVSRNEDVHMLQIKRKETETKT
uniref:Uncharacterized protein n=1 Tax=Anguilla anguilla TaxID=7936 RepID=A0A0E9P6K5_ANGAN